MFILSNVLCFLQTYVDYMSRLYEREIKDFFEVAKIKMAGTSKEAKSKFGKKYSALGCKSVNMKYISVLVLILQCVTRNCYSFNVFFSLYASYTFLQSNTSPHLFIVFSLVYVHTI